MTQELSALMDGETDPAEAEKALNALRRDEELRRAWDSYHLIGAALRGEDELHADLVPRVMADLRDEPVVLAPRRDSVGAPRRQAWMALAASITGAAFGLWLALSPATPAPGPVIAAKAVVAPATENPGRIQEYLVAHQTYAPGLNPQGGARYIRTVAVAEASPR
ncbi:MAG TPA: sigma-E factor negative regulatory protein [Rhodocyclaceae bacterium]|nr:sigma-E factor negative regulatory protein [Rhodocyclaceae bacterium]HNH34292.1 sigma-E factor negative regulatory protein [Rhodocyclaceae bacterium]